LVQNSVEEPIDCAVGILWEIVETVFSGGELGSIRCDRWFVRKVLLNRFLERVDCVGDLIFGSLTALALRIVSVSRRRVGENPECFGIPSLLDLCFGNVVIQGVDNTLRKMNFRISPVDFWRFQTPKQTAAVEGEIGSSPEAFDVLSCDTIRLSHPVKNDLIIAPRPVLAFVFKVHARSVQTMRHERDSIFFQKHDLLAGVDELSGERSAPHSTTDDYMWRTCICSLAVGARRSSADRYRFPDLAHKVYFL
jgi:hypothetical protein